MRILLVIPTCEYKTRYPVIVSNSDFPTGFAYLASALRKAGHEVFGLNPNNIFGYNSAYEMLRNELTKSVNDCQPELIGIGGLCTDFGFLMDTVKLCRNLVPDVPIVCGGGIVNNDSQFIFETLRPDYCVIGEGEETLVHLAQTIATGTNEFHKIANLGYWQQGKALFNNQDHKYLDLDSREFPDYEPFGIDNMLDNYGFASRYLYRYTRLKPRPMTIVTARSCPFECTFCVHHRGPKYRTRSIENIMEEIESLYDRYQFNILHFQDELFVANSTRLQQFCEIMIERRKSFGWDFDWLFVTHASASLRSQDVKMAKEAGCYFFSYGMESGSAAILTSMNKKTKPEQLKVGVEISQEVGIGFGGNFIFGDTAETVETIDETLNFLATNCVNNHVFIGAVRPYPGSKLFDICLEKKIIKDKRQYYNHMDESVFNMTSIPDKLWQAWICQLNLIGERFPWVSTVPANYYQEEISEFALPFKSGESKKLYMVGANCPHCGNEVSCRELLDLNVRLLSFPVRVVKFAYNYLTGGEFERKRLNKYVLYKLKSSLNLLNANMIRTHKLFKLLNRLMTNDTSNDISFLTGCIHCHKRFKISLSNLSLVGSHITHV